MLAKKLLVNDGIFTFAGGENPLDLPLIPLASVLSAIPW
jgi:hypothetical protein